LLEVAVEAETYQMETAQAVEVQVVIAHLF
jgi:hypothetical protein